MIRATYRSDPLSSCCACSVIFPHKNNRYSLLGTFRNELQIKTFHLADEANAVEQAVDAVLAEGYRTADIAKAGEKAIGTLEMGRLICDRI